MLNLSAAFWTNTGSGLDRLFSLWFAFPSFVFFLVVCYMIWTSAKIRRKRKLAESKRLSETMVSALQHLKGVSGIVGIRNSNGWAFYAPILFIAVFVAGLLAGRMWPEGQRYAYFDLRVKEVRSQKMHLLSASTGPFWADFCPKPDIAKYEPQPGYVLCKMQYVDKGCMDISSKRDGFWWVKDKEGKTVTLDENDTYQPFPSCVKNELSAKGNLNAR